MSDTCVGVDVSTKRLALVYLPTVEVEVWELAAGRTMRLASAYQAALSLIDEHSIVLCEDPPYVQNRSVYAALQRVLGCFLAGCATAGARHIMAPIPCSQWKLETLGKGHGNASKREVAVDVIRRYPKLARYDGDDDVTDAACIAHVCQEWWASRRELAS